MEIKRMDGSMPTEKERKAQRGHLNNGAGPIGDWKRHNPYPETRNQAHALKIGRGSWSWLTGRVWARWPDDDAAGLEYYQAI